MGNSLDGKTTYSLELVETILDFPPTNWIIFFLFIQEIIQFFTIYHTKQFPLHLMIISLKELMHILNWYWQKNCQPPDICSLTYECIINYNIKVIIETFMTWNNLSALSSWIEFPLIVLFFLLYKNRWTSHLSSMEITTRGRARGAGEKISKNI